MTNIRLQHGLFHWVWRMECEHTLWDELRNCLDFPESISDYKDEYSTAWHRYTTLDELGEKAVCDQHDFLHWQLAYVYQKAVGCHMDIDGMREEMVIFRPENLCCNVEPDTGCLFEPCLLRRVAGLQD